ncbi:retron St85 family RNA-directed DNA polymerase [Methylomonas paludis]|uniref:RNA-directed DNA polymerase n=1 Tax=Methylomonas paludis TaxID=1173101 RepID=A0A975MML4_9GAMM|nr:retron St85 family RNA-directed DNA polymerase [Methylomonas paludis]QWF70572.1 retron St85 family RNA-directed DNA polymerase [Methylomonas paludis]
MNVIEIILHEFPLGRQEVERLIRTAPSRYKVHEIEKRNGRGKRTIAQPTAEIKLLQRYLVDRYISNLPVNDAAKAYRLNHNILDHASPHAKNQYLLKLDFKDFFPSIRAVDFIKHLRKYSALSREDMKTLSRVFFWRPKGQRDLILSIGAPSSPAISNTILFDFDSAVIEHCIKNEITYTRYADDLALSTNQPNILNDAYIFVEMLCRSLKTPKLTLNADKTVFTSKKHHRQLTGLVLSNAGTASIGREKKRTIRAMAHHYKQGILSQEEHGRLRGWLAFMMSIDREFVTTIEKMIGEVAFQKLMQD